MKLACLENGGAEIFYSLQGEGVNVGRPSVFVRTSLCNLHCSWCDTAYTWNFEGTPWAHDGGEKYKKSEVLREMSVLEVANLIRGFPCKDLVLTGGEPLLHDEDWVALLAELGEEYSAEFETNGTIVPSAELDALGGGYNVSPKLAGSGNEQKLREKEEAFQFFVKAAQAGRAVFKFVYEGKESLKEIQGLEERYRIEKGQIYLMPEGRTSEEVRAKSGELSALCLSEGYRFSDRLHLHLYGSGRGC